MVILGKIWLNHKWLYLFIVILWPLNWFKTIAFEKIFDWTDLSYSRFISFEISSKIIKTKLCLQREGRFSDWVDPVSNWVLPSFSLCNMKSRGGEKGKKVGGSLKKLSLEKDALEKKRVKTNFKFYTWIYVLGLVVQFPPWEKRGTMKNPPKI